MRQFHSNFRSLHWDLLWRLHPQEAAVEAQRGSAVSDLFQHSMPVLLRHALLLWLWKCQNGRHNHAIFYKVSTSATTTNTTNLDLCGLLLVQESYLKMVSRETTFLQNIAQHILSSVDLAGCILFLAAWYCLKYRIVFWVHLGVSAFVLRLKAGRPHLLSERKCRELWVSGLAQWGLIP